MTDLLERLRSAVGDDHVLTEPTDVAAYVVDWTGTHRGRALAVVRPGSTTEVAEVVRACAETRTPLVPQGGNTGLVGGGVPDGSGTAVVLSLGRMRTVRDVDPVAGTLTVDAGVVLADVQAAAAAVDRLFPMSLGSEGSCTIGGNLATNAGGTAVLRYGMTRELVLGLEVVLPDGRVWDGLRGLRKDNTGYDLTQLFVGSEGTLGVITGAVLRIFPATPRHATAWVAVPSVAAAVSLLGIAQEHAGVHLSTFEIANRQALDLVLAHLPGAVDPLEAPSEWYVLVELAGSAADGGLDATLEALLADAVEAGRAMDAAIATGPGRRSALWSLREGISEVQKVEGATLKHDVTLPIADLAAWTDAMGPVLQEVLPGVRPVTYGHVGDGNLHYNLNAPIGRDDDLRAAAGDLTAAIHEAVAAAHGSISAEHGLGRTKAAAAAAYKSDVEVDLMRALKRALDPDGLMNPSVLLTAP
ncbi:FAD-binding oxidoreductase [Mycobacterium cookii]|uniref:FAD-binding oxidoreductase n=1 Tax=Nocardioides furvisabuli TaxID=375542 RepID=A0ABN2XIF6_9ACTN|nr:FAD-binding oxidoreductase [Nocardioides furvisabuli]